MIFWISFWIEFWIESFLRSESMKKMNEKRSPTPSCAKINYPKGLTSWELDISSHEVFYWLQGLSWSSVATPLSTLQTSSTEHLKNTRMGLQPTVFAETQSIKKHFLTMILLQGKDGLALKRCTRSPRKRCTGWKSLWLLGIGPSMLATMTGWRWVGISKLFLTVHPEATTPHYSDQVTEGKAYRLRIGQFLARYSTLGDALSPDPCPRWQTGHTRAANMSFSARWVQRPENMTKLYIFLRDLDQDENNTTHCANATFINPGANRWGLVSCPTRLSYQEQRNIA